MLYLYLNPGEQPPASLINQVGPGGPLSDVESSEYDMLALFGPSQRKRNTYLIRTISTKTKKLSYVYHAILYGQSIIKQLALFLAFV